MEIIGPLIAAVLTLMVFSYIIGDNVLFRLASHIFVGVAIGYALILVIYDVFLPAIAGGASPVATLVAFLLSLFLLFKIRPTQNILGNTLGSLTLAFVLGVGAALAISGALFGTLLPQVTASIFSLNPADYPNTETEVGAVTWLNNVIIFLGTIGTLFYFTFAVRSHGPFSGLREGTIRFWAGMGRLMIIFTLGALFANTVGARVALLVARLQFLAGFFEGQ
jgi:hypothetical protein